MKYKNKIKIEAPKNIIMSKHIFQHGSESFTQQRQLIKFKSISSTGEATTVDFFPQLLLDD